MTVTCDYICLNCYKIMKSIPTTYQDDYKKTYKR